MGKYAREIRDRRRISSNCLCRCGRDVGKRLALAWPVQFLAGLLAARQVEIIQHQPALEVLDGLGRIDAFGAGA